MILRDLIVKGKISGEQAVQAISFLPGTLETPTKELLSSFFVRFFFLQSIRIWA